MQNLITIERIEKPLSSKKLHILLIFKLNIFSRCAIVFKCKLFQFNGSSGYL